jgi:hypothetical protein
VARALSFTLGKGVVALRGTKKRPWLEIVRPETQRTYLDHQLRSLRKLHDGPIDAVWDVIPTNGFYDKERLRLHGEGMWRVHELRCPHDQALITREVLDICGIQGAAALWIDQGRFVGKYGKISGRFKSEQLVTIADWLTDMGFQSSCHGNGDRYFEVCIKQCAIKDFIDAIRPYVHVSMKNKLCKYRYKI